MNSRPFLFFKRAFDSANRYQSIVFLFCLLFGIAMILNSNCTADGVWFGYATLFHHGVKLYSQLHFVQQPFFVLETAWFLDLLGTGWLVSKVPAVLHLLAYTLGILWIARQLPLNDRQRALLMGAAFILTVNSVAYRFDDYHAVADSCVVLCVAVLLTVYQKRKSPGGLAWVVLAGVLTALAFETRSNDGAALFLGAGISILCLVRYRRMLSLVCFVGAAIASVFAIVRLTGDSFRAYWTLSVLHATNSKGGAGAVSRAPLHLPVGALSLYRDYHRSVLIFALFLFACLAWTYLIHPAISTRRRKTIYAAIVSIVLLVLISVLLWRHGLFSRVFLLSIWVPVIIMIYALGIFCAFRVIRCASGHEQGWNPLEVLWILLLGQVCSGAMSSGGRLDEAYAPFALLLLLLPIAFPFRFGPALRELLFAAAAILLCFGCVHRIVEPLRWLNEVNDPMFTGRTWYRHPVYGPMYIQRDMLAFIEPVCRSVSDAGQAELLSLPYSFANYFCAVPPYRDHVQTWYDTSSTTTISGLIDELERSPPLWILYEDQPETVHINETSFNGGRPIPYRALQDFIRQKLEQGSWKVTYTSSYGGTREWTGQWLSQKWFLIRTR